MKKSKPTKNTCPLTTDPKKRRAADKLAASVKDTFPPGLSQPALRALAAAGLGNLDQCTRITETDLAKLHGMGPKAVEIIRDALRARGKHFKT
jgi:hypothetical protein